MAVAKTRQGTLTIAGAPRYQHRGVVMVAFGNLLRKKIDPFPWQVCVYNSFLKDKACYTNIFFNKKCCFLPLCNSFY